MSTSLAAVAVLVTQSAAAGIGDPLSELPVPLLQQVGDVNNCGPTAAAMLLGAYEGLEEDRLVALRDEMGRWSWDRWPLRRMSLPGYDAGMTTPSMLESTLNHFARGASFELAIERHPWLPPEAWSVIALKARLAEGRPVLALVQSDILWKQPAAGLHWIVVRAMRDGRVVYNDPADNQRWVIPADQFWEAWRLNDLFRSLNVFASFTGLSADRPLPAFEAAKTLRMLNLPGLSAQPAAMAVK